MTHSYSRVLIKLSGESLSSDHHDLSPGGIDTEITLSVAKELVKLQSLGVEVGIVIGGGNLWRGGRGKGLNFPRVGSDQLGMMATVMNALALKNALETLGMTAMHHCAVAIPGICHAFDSDQAIDHLQRHGMVIFSGGTGHPFFSTDTASALRAAQIKAQAILKSTQVDGIYDMDPQLYLQAKKLPTVTFQEAIEKRLRVMDVTAFDICQGAGIEIRVFKNAPGSFERVLTDSSFGSTVVADEPMNVKNP